MTIFDRDWCMNLGLGWETPGSSDKTHHRNLVRLLTPLTPQTLRTLKLTISEWWRVGQCGGRPPAHAGSKHPPPGGQSPHKVNGQTKYQSHVSFQTTQSIVCCPLALQPAVYPSLPNRTDVHPRELTSQPREEVGGGNSQIIPQNNQLQPTK
jgi:hypothetical protein